MLKKWEKMWEWSDLSVTYKHIEEPAEKNKLK